MKRNLQPLLNRIPYSKSRFHSAILTAFNVNFQFFESQVLRILNDKYISSVNILVDQRQLNESFYKMTDLPATAGTRYGVNAIRSVGAFHPKVNFVLGKDELILLVGSGNLTYGGHGLNHELFTGFYANQKDSSQLPLILEAWEYLKQFENQVVGFGKDRIFREVYSNCSLLKGVVSEKHAFHEIDYKSNRRCALLYNEKNSTMIQQVQDLVPLQDVEEIEVLSPYFDSDGSFLLALYDLCPSLRRMSVLLQKNCQLPPIEMKVGNRNIVCFDFDGFEPGQQSHKFLHGKAILFHTRLHDYLVVGSANATTAAFGSLKEKTINDEFSVLYESAPGFYKKELSLAKFDKLPQIKFADLFANMPRGNSCGRSEDTGSFPIRLLAADYSANTLTLSCTWNGHIHQENLKLNVYDDEGDLRHSVPVRLGERMKVVLELNNNDKMARIVDSENAFCSDVVVISHCDQLIYTSPSKKFSRMLEIYNSMLNGSYADLEISSYLADLYYDIECDAHPKSSSHKKSDKVLDSVDSSEELKALQDRMLQESSDDNVSLEMAKNRIPHFYDHLMSVLMVHSNRKAQLAQDKEEENNEDAWDSNPAEKRSIDDKIELNLTPVSEDVLYSIRWSAKYMAERYLALCKKLYFSDTKKKALDETDLMYYVLVMHYLVQMCLWSPSEMDFSDDEKKKCGADEAKINDYYQNLDDELEEIEKFWNYVANILVSNFAFILLDYHNRGCIDKSSMKYEGLAKQVINYTLLFLNERDTNATTSNDEIFQQLNAHPLVNMIEALGSLEETDVKKFQNLISDNYDIEEITGLYSIYRDAIQLREDKSKFRFVQGKGYLRVSGKQLKSLEYKNKTNF